MSLGISFQLVIAQYILECYQLLQKIKVICSYLITGECPWPKLHYTRLLIEWKVGDINRTRTLQMKIRRLLVLSIKTIIIQYLQYIAKYLSVAQCEFTTPHNAKNSKGIEWLGKLEQSAISKLYLCISSTYRVHREKHYNITRHLFSCSVKFLSMHPVEVHSRLYALYCYKNSFSIGIVVFMVKVEASFSWKIWKILLDNILIIPSLYCSKLKKWCWNITISTKKWFILFM